MRQKEKIGLITLIVSLIFAIVISLYHLTGDDSKLWSALWALSENGLLLTLSLYAAYLSEGFMKVFFQWVLPPYFIIKLMYHLSCYVGIYLISPEAWSVLWSGIAASYLACGAICCLIKFSQNENKRNDPGDAK